MSNQKATKELIGAPTVNRVMSKDGKTCLGYLVKSNSSDTYYQITWSQEEHRYQCSCPATRECCHIKAVKEVVAARRALQVLPQPPEQQVIPASTLAAAAEVIETVGTLVRPPAPIVACPVEAPLHGSRPSPVPAGAGNPTAISAWLPMR